MVCQCLERGDEWEIARAKAKSGWKSKNAGVFGNVA